VGAEESVIQVVATQMVTGVRVAPVVIFIQRVEVKMALLRLMMIHQDLNWVDKAEQILQAEMGGLVEMQVSKVLFSQILPVEMEVLVGRVIHQVEVSVVEAEGVGGRDMVVEEGAVPAVVVVVTVEPVEAQEAPMRLRQVIMHY
jgi:hypothetical protein